MARLAAAMSACLLMCVVSLSVADFFDADYIFLLSLIFLISSIFLFLCFSGLRHGTPRCSRSAAEACEALRDRGVHCVTCEVRQPTPRHSGSRRARQCSIVSRTLRLPLWKLRERPGGPRALSQPHSHCRQQPHVVHVRVAPNTPVASPSTPVAALAGCCRNTFGWLVVLCLVESTP